MSGSPIYEYNPVCSLCRLWKDREIKTKLYYEDGNCIIVDCLTCGVPMAVLKSHVKSPSKDTVNLIRSALFSLFGDGSIRGPCNILDHYHEHFVGRK